MREDGGALIVAGLRRGRLRAPPGPRAGLILLWFALCLLSFRTAAAQADDPAAAIPLTAYETELRTVRARLAAAGASAATVEEARHSLHAIEAVSLPAGGEIELRPLLGRSDEPLTPVAAVARIDLVLAQLAAASNDNTAARLAALEQVLAGPEFGAGESLLDRLRRWLAELWARFFPARNESPAQGAAASAAADLVRLGVALAGAVLLIWVLSYWLQKLLAGFVADDDSAQTVPGERLPTSPAAARSQAEATARAGDYRNAVRFLYLSALLTLEEHGLVLRDRTLTNRELLSRVPGDHVLRPHLQPVVDTFDAVWYGVHEPDNQTFRSYAQSIDALEALATARPVQER